MGLRDHGGGDSKGFSIRAASHERLAASKGLLSFWPVLPVSTTLGDTVFQGPNPASSHCHHSRSSLSPSLFVAPPPIYLKQVEPGPSLPSSTSPIRYNPKGYRPSAHSSNPGKQAARGLQAPLQEGLTFKGSLGTANHKFSFSFYNASST